MPYRLDQEYAEAEFKSSLAEIKTVKQMGKFHSQLWGPGSASMLPFRKASTRSC
jgi:hypothetical protein